MKFIDFKLTGITEEISFLIELLNFCSDFPWIVLFIFLLIINASGIPGSRVDLTLFSLKICSLTSGRLGEIVSSVKFIVLSLSETLVFSCPQMFFFSFAGHVILRPILQGDCMYTLSKLSFIVLLLLLLLKPSFFVTLVNFGFLVSSFALVLFPTVVMVT